MRRKLYMDEKGRFFLDRAQPVVYSHGTYYALGKAVGSFGYSVKKQAASRKKEVKVRHRDLRCLFLTEEESFKETSPHNRILAIFTADMIQRLIQTSAFAGERRHGCFLAAVCHEESAASVRAETGRSNKEIWEGSAHETSLEVRIPRRRMGD